MFQLSNKAIQTIKIIFNGFFIFFIIFQLLERAFYSLPNDWFFFLTSGAMENFICTIIVYLLYCYVLKRKQFWCKFSFVTFFIIIIVLLALLKSFRVYNEISVERTFNYFTQFLGIIFLFYALIYFVNRLEFFIRYKKLEIELNKVKEQLLRNQLHPHFLFNAFNSLYSMSLQNHPKTPDTILKLSGMMRYLTDDTDIKVRLSKEIEFIEQYITIEKMRFGEQSKINFTIEGDSNNVYIEPLLLVTFVENAFKHGFYTNDSNNFITIFMKISKDVLEFRVKNNIQTKQHFQEQKREGKGLENVKQRLKIAYPKKHSFSIKNMENTFEIDLKIDIS